MKNTNINRYKTYFRIIINILLIVILSYQYYNVWVDVYNDFLRFSYLRKGNYFMALIYALILTLFQTIYGGSKIGEYRLNNIIFSETLALVITNVIVYVAIIVPAAALGFINPLAILYTTMYQIIVIVIWAILVDYIMKKIFPPSKMLLIYGNLYKDKLMEKFIKRKDIYTIEESICIDEDEEKIKQKCNIYDNIIIGDIKSEKRNELLKYCFIKSKIAFVLPKLSDIILNKSENYYLFDSPLYISRNEGIPLEMTIVKRIMDILVSIIIILLLSPILILISICIKLEDGGPILFVQERITKNNKKFNIIKFRSMKVSNDYKVRPTEQSDERITKVGRIIRLTHMDELPQFFNVIKGDMSIVGPRPERREHVELYSKEISEFSYRLKVKAGITGLAQIYGKYNTEAYDKLKFDLIYIQNYSFIMDLEIVLKTIKVLFIKEKTEGFEKEKSKEIQKNA
ncbi:MAG: exopolysaccharide biosynthesis polyprenyl glycosylphosphotransferase [Eubacteriales bacterium]|nr:exopolysaccharide biosynthesis polyprenyl glycosylphosphotransferase [Eubacteriales bacterium]